MAQVSYAADLVSQLTTNDTAEEELTERLAAQLSHSDGIRGFFVTYLTGEGGDTPADLDSVPTPLATALKQANPHELIPLACKNDMNSICFVGYVMLYSYERISIF